jgi:hypothetical protein
MAAKAMSQKAIQPSSSSAPSRPATMMTRSARRFPVDHLHPGLGCGVPVVLPCLVKHVALIPVGRIAQPQVRDRGSCSRRVAELARSVVVLPSRRGLTQAEVDIAELECAPRPQDDGVEDGLGAAVESVLVCLRLVARSDGAGDPGRDFTAGRIAPVADLADGPGRVVDDEQGDEHEPEARAEAGDGFDVSAAYEAVPHAP